MKIVDISVGSSHTLALSNRGEVWGWGRNNFGQLGLEGTEWLDEPRVIRELSDKFILQISAGSWHSCAWTSPPPPSPATSAAAAEVAAAHLNLTGAAAGPTATTRSHPLPSSPTPHGLLFALAPVSLGLPERLPSAEEHPHLHAAATPATTAIVSERCCPVSMHALRERLKLLHLVSELTSSSWRLFPDFSLEGWWCRGGDRRGGGGGCGGLARVFGSDEARSILSPKVAALPLAQILQRTMVQGRNYGPVVTVKRLQTSDNSSASTDSTSEATSIFIQLASQVARLDPSDLRLPARSWKVRKGHYKIWCCKICL